MQVEAKAWKLWLSISISPLLWLMVIGSEVRGSGRLDIDTAVIV
ncbi:MULTISPECIES: hypothetical protein [unclassified Microcoleus]